MNRKYQTTAIVTGGLLAAAVGAAVLSGRSDDTSAPASEPLSNSVAPEEIQAAPARDAIQLAAPQAAPTADPITHDSNALTFRAHFPQHPDLRTVTTKLRKEANVYLQRAQQEARDAATSIATPQWEVNIAWTPIATSGGYVSLIGRSNEYRGGAHPIQLVDTRLVRLEDGQEIPQSNFFTTRTWPTPAVAIAVCEQLKAAKTVTVGAPTIFDEPIICAGPNNNIRLDEARLAFAASQTNSGFGGLHVFYQAYAIGSYAEGAYEFTIPADVFREDLAKEYQSLFTGDPAPLVD